jgi:hypothetical protein
LGLRPAAGKCIYGEQWFGRQGLAAVVTKAGRILQDNPAAGAGKGMAAKLTEKGGCVVVLVTV